MKNNKFKILTLVLLVALVLSINILDAFAGTTQGHVHNKSGSWSEYDGSSSRNDSEHYIYYWNYEACSICGQVLRTYKTTDIEYHELVRDDWHMGSRHYTKYECQICPYSKTISYACPGNPCIIDVYRIKEIMIEEN